RIVCGFEQDGFTRFGVLDPDSGTLDELDVGLDSWRSPYVVAEGRDVVVVAASTTEPAQVARVDTATGERDVLRQSLEVPIPADFVSISQAIEFPTEDGLTAHAH